MELNKIYNESCIDTMGRMPDEFLDLTVTSPPYDDLRDYQGYIFNCEATAQSLFRVTKVGGVVIWVVGDRTKSGDETCTSFQHALTFKSHGFKLWDTMIFQKSNPFPGDCGKRYKQSFEYIFAFVKGKDPATFNPILVPAKNPGKVLSKARLEASGRRNLEKGWHGYGDKPLTVADEVKASNVFTYTVGIKTGYKHPAVFPEQLAKDQILSWSNAGDVVYDPFLGSGTTAKIAQTLNRQWIGSEISAEYVALANKRLSVSNADITPAQRA